MSEESEKRFEEIMNKLFHTPNSSSRHGNETTTSLLSGKKRRYSSSSASMGMGGRRNVFEEEEEEFGKSSISASPPPSCRPWDRRDLFRRLSTFKSMTWFAKPQVVSPLDCARRGWVNVDIDTIACASCDARLLFSTPSVWTQQQVEKAAMVFSLKLKSGHKLLCPWINNACTEELTQFPIVSLADLTEDYEKRFHALSQLVALPVILPGATANVRSPQLDRFLAEFSTSGNHVSVEKPTTELHGGIPELISSTSYYQAQKLICLFGWEAHMLPYLVDLKDGQNQSIKDVNVIVTTGQKQKVSVYSLCAKKGSCELQLDPCSVVLDCKLCGASVGLWAFSRIRQPQEYFRFVGLTEVNGKNISTHDEVSRQEKSSASNETHTGNREGITNNVTTASTPVGFTIAGGPPPDMLNYGATISVPVIGQGLRARFAIEIGTNDHLVENLSQVEDDQMSLESSQVNTEGTSATTSPLDKLQSSHKSKEFDPIKQHRHFCPWIESNGKVAPGWQQTLSAIESHNDSFSSPSKTPSSTLIEVDDPVASVRQLFTSPNEKRAKVIVKANVLL